LKIFEKENTGEKDGGGTVTATQSKKGTKNNTVVQKDDQTTISHNSQLMPEEIH